MMLSMQSQASVESGENKLICPHYEKRHYVLQLLLIRSHRNASVRCWESEMNSSWEFMLKQQHSRQSKATNTKFLRDRLLTNWTNVTGNTCKREAERESLMLCGGSATSPFPFTGDPLQIGRSSEDLCKLDTLAPTASAGVPRSLAAACSASWRSDWLFLLWHVCRWREQSVLRETPENVLM